MFLHVMKTPDVILKLVTFSATKEEKKKKLLCIYTPGSILNIKMSSDVF